MSKQVQGSEIKEEGSNEIGNMGKILNTQRREKHKKEREREKQTITRSENFAQFVNLDNVVYI